MHTSELYIQLKHPVPFSPSVNSCESQLVLSAEQQDTSVYAMPPIDICLRANSTFPPEIKTSKESQQPTSLWNTESVKSIMRKHIFYKKIKGHSAFKETKTKRQVCQLNVVPLG